MENVAQFVRLMHVIRDYLETIDIIVSFWRGKSPLNLFVALHDQRCFPSLLMLPEGSLVIYNAYVSPCSFVEYKVAMDTSVY